MTDASTCAARAVVIGAGPAGLMAAETLARRGMAVAMFEKMPSAARKFLMAGRGGLNLTHSEALETFLGRYGAARDWLEPAIRAFPPEALRAWADELGAATFVGSSGRVFPRAMKASPLLRAWLRRLNGLGVTFHFGAAWRGWDAEGALAFDGAAAVRADITVLALGGASWPKLGADGGWAEILRAKGVAVAPFRPANAGFDVAWSESFAGRFAGQPLKGVAISFGGRAQRGEAMVARYGLEGGAIYALSAALRAGIERDGAAAIAVDLRPEMRVEALAARLEKPAGGQSLANVLRKAAGLSPVAVNLMREAGPLPREPHALAALIKAVPVRLTGMQGLSRAISSAGGIARDEVDDAFQLKRLPGVYAVGEMLDWEAPTGGYLLQACFSTARAAGLAALSI